MTELINKLMDSGLAEELFLTATKPVVKICVLASVGLYLARTGVVDPTGRKLLSLLAVKIFIPSLILVKLASSASAAVLAEWWPIPVNVLTIILAGQAVGWVLTKMVGTPRWFRAHARIAIGMPNLGNLPLVLIPAIAADPSAGFAKGSVDRAVAYMSLGISVASVYMWSVVYRALAPPDIDVESITDGDDISVIESAYTATGTARGRSPELRAGYHRSLDSPQFRFADFAMGRPSLHGQGRTRSTPLQAPLTGVDSAMLIAQSVKASDEAAAGGSQVSGISAGVDMEAADVAAADVAAADVAPPHRRHCCSPDRRLCRNCLAVWHWLQPYMTPATVATLVGVALGCMPAVKRLVFLNDPPGQLHLVAETLETLAGALVPSLLIVIGATLSEGPAAAANVHWPTVVVVILGRLVIMPVLGLATIFAIVKAGIFSPPDKMFVFVMLIQNTMPTALNLQVVTSLHDNGAAEITIILFWQYITSIFILPCWLLIHLQVLDNILPGTMTWEQSDVSAADALTDAYNSFGGDLPSWAGVVGS